MVDGPNTYGFCGGDPVNRVDPMGTKLEARIKDGDDGKPVVEIWHHPELFWRELMFGGGGLVVAGIRKLGGSEKVGELDPSTGFVKFTSASGKTKYTTMSYLKKWDESYTGRQYWGVGSSEYDAPNRSWEEGELQENSSRYLKCALSYYFSLYKANGYDAPGDEEIFDSLDSAAGYVEDLMWFYATFGLEIAQASESARAFQALDSVDTVTDLRKGGKAKGHVGAVLGDVVDGTSPEGVRRFQNLRKAINVAQGDQNCITCVSAYLKSRLEKAKYTTQDILKKWNRAEDFVEADGVSIDEAKEWIQKATNATLKESHGTWDEMIREGYYVLMHNSHVVVGRVKKVHDQYRRTLFCPQSGDVFRDYESLRSARGAMRIFVVMP